MKTLHSRTLTGIWLALAAFSVAVYLLVSQTATPAGFPLDDAWIHQVFARNLAWRGEWAYNPGQPVSGSTSPLWTVLLVPGYVGVGVGFYPLWTYGLGIVFLALTAREVYRLTFHLCGHRGAALGAALFSLFEWRLAWAGSSGMETIVFAFGSLFVTRYYLTHFPATSPPGDPARKEAAATGPWVALALGGAGGLLTLVRPEGIILLGLAALDLGGRLRHHPGRLARQWSLLLAGSLVVLLPYFIFNFALSGSPLPNTFSAKVSGYADLSLPTLLGYFREGLYQLFLTGPVFMLIPGLGWCAGAIRQNRLDWRPLVWPPLLMVLYALRLPVTYHHARYLMPLIPFLIVYGAAGTVEVMDWLRRQRLPVVARSLPWLIGLAVGLAWYNGALAYRFDVKFINDEQVRIGRWLNQNTPPAALIATHDIGAIAYFSERKLIDTAGLVSPEFISIVRDQPAILAKVQALGVDYFALLPDWYAELYQELEKQQRKVFQPQETYLKDFGQENMAVFKLR